MDFPQANVGVVMLPCDTANANTAICTKLTPRDTLDEDNHLVELIAN